MVYYYNVIIVVNEFVLIEIYIVWLIILNRVNDYKVFWVDNVCNSINLLILCYGVCEVLCSIVIYC